MTMITGTHNESMVVRGVTRVLIADFCLELRYIELYYIYQLLGIDTIMAVTKYSKQHTKLSKLRSFDRLKRMTTCQSRACKQRAYSQF